MTEQRGPEPEARPEEQPRRRNRNARAQFFDFKASHWVEVALTVVLIGVGAAQALVYWRQTGIIKEQAGIAAAQNRLTIENSRAFLILRDISYVRKEPDAEADGRDFIMTIKNVGKHVATVTAIYTEPFYGVVHKELPDTPQFYNSISLVAPPIAPDSETTIRAHMGGARSLTSQPVLPIETVLKGANDGTIPIWIYGRVLYETGFAGVLGELGFCNKFVPPSQRTSVSPLIFVTCNYSAYTYVR